jgi:osmotically-inducible protein OsmY
LNATSSREGSRVYSTNQADQSAGGSFSSSASSSGSSGSLGLTVQGATESDQKLADQVRQELRSNSAFNAGMSRLRISLDNGKATLRGTVKSDQDKQDAEKAVQKVTGVTSVQNELRVSSSSGQSGTEESK